MTNLLPSPRLPWLTRARVLVGLPIAGVIVLMTPLVGVFLLPRWQDVQEVQQRRDTLLELQRNLPSLERNLEASKVVLVQAQQQQGLLLSLLAGSGKVQTFLALLNQQARQSGVTIRRYEPHQDDCPVVGFKADVEQGRGRRHTARSSPVSGVSEVLACFSGHRPFCWFAAVSPADGGFGTARRKQRSRAQGCCQAGQESDAL